MNSYFISACLVAIAVFAAPANAGLVFKCVNDDGSISGGTLENSCKNLLPKCSNAHEKYKAEVFESLSLKIYGYHKGYDLNVSKTTAETPVGNPMPLPVCSVVGKSIQYKGDRDLALQYRDMGSSVANNGYTNYTNTQACGKLPKAEIDKENRAIYLKFEGTEGNTVGSWMLGAMPYEIRAQAYDFFQTVKTPSDLDAALTDPELAAAKTKFAEAQQRSDNFLNSLSAEARAACNDPGYATLVDRCIQTPGHDPLSLDEPAIRLCNLAKASMIMNKISVSRLIEFHIMKKAIASFDQHFGSTFLDAHASPLWGNLAKKASEDSGFWDCFFNLTGRRKCAATVVSGVMGDGSWKIPSDQWDAEQSSDSPSTPRVGRRFFGFLLDGSNTVMRANLPSNSAPYHRGTLSSNPNFSFVQFLAGAVGAVVDAAGKLIGAVAGFFAGLFGGDDEEERVKELMDQATEAYNSFLNSEDMGTSPSNRGSRSMTLSSGIGAVIEKIIRVDICQQSSPGAFSARCDETSIPNKPNNGVTYSW